MNRDHGSGLSRLQGADRVHGGWYGGLWSTDAEGSGVAAVTGDSLATEQLPAPPELDFSVNVNPYGPDPRVVAAAMAAVSGGAMTRYPDPRAMRLKKALAARDGFDPRQVVVGNGAADLLWGLARALVHQTTRVLIVEPTFSEFRAAAESLTPYVDEWRASEASGFQVSIADLARQAREVAAEVIYLCTPNSPTGVHVPSTAVATLAWELPNASIVLDEAFLSLSAASDDLKVPLPSNVIRVRSLTKEHAIPGLRLGHVITSVSLAQRLEAHRPFWSINAVAQAAGLAAMGAEDFVAASRRQLIADAEELRSCLAAVGLAPLPTAAPFLLTRVPRADAVMKRLAATGILVRGCASYGLPDFLRFAARPAADCQRLQRTLRTILAADQEGGTPC